VALAGRDLIDRADLDLSETLGVLPRLVCHESSRLPPVG
jgi:hypothetical protein